MLRYLLLVLLIAHGSIHLMGFIKGNNSAAIPQLTKNITKSMGIVWLVTGMLFFITAITFFLNAKDWWWLRGISIIMSQVLIVLAWKDAKFGTIANGVLLLVMILQFFAWQFEHSYQKDYRKGLRRTQMLPIEIITEKDLAHLPTPVQKYLHYVGVVGKPKVHHTNINFKGEMRSKEQDWFAFTSEQYNFFDEPTRLFFMKAIINGLPINGYHRYIDNQASMTIKLLSAFSVVKEKNLFQAETVTLFNEMCLFTPATLIQENIQWEAIDELSAKATFTNKDISITATLYFNAPGQLINFVSDDRFDINNKQIYRFSTPVSDYRSINGYRICHYGEVIWHYPEGKFIYGKFHLEDLAYNTPSPKKEIDLLELIHFFTTTGIIKNLEYKND